MSGPPYPHSLYGPDPLSHDSELMVFFSLLSQRAETVSASSHSLAADVEPHPGLCWWPWEAGI